MNNLKTNNINSNNNNNNNNCNAIKNNYNENYTPENNNSSNNLIKVNLNDKLQVLIIRQKTLKNQKLVLELVLNNLIEEKATAAILQASRFFLKPYTTTIHQIKKQTQEIIEELDDIDTLLKSRKFNANPNDSSYALSQVQLSTLSSPINNSYLTSIIRWYSKVCSALQSFNTLNLDSWYSGIMYICNLLEVIARREMRILHHNKMMMKYSNNYFSSYSKIEKNNYANNRNGAIDENNQNINLNMVNNINGNKNEEERGRKISNDFQFNSDNYSNNYKSNRNNNNDDVDDNVEDNNYKMDDYNYAVAVQPYHALFLDIYTDQITKSLSLMIKSLFYQFVKKQNQLNSLEINNICVVYLSALDTLQGLYLLNKGCKVRFYNPEIIYILLRTLDLTGYFALKLGALETLQVLAICCPSSVSIIEQQQGISKIIALLKRRYAEEYVRLKIIEFLYIYLSEESTEDPQELVNRKEKLAKLVGKNFVSKLSEETDLKKIFGKKAQETFTLDQDPFSPK